MADGDKRLDEDRIKVICRQEFAYLMDYLFGLNINDPAQRLKALQRMQSLLEDGRMNDFTFLRKWRLDVKERNQELKITFWSSLRKFITPVLSAIAAAVVSWIEYNNHK